MNSTASIRRQSTIDHMGAATVTTTTTAATNVPQFHSSGRPTLIMTSSAQSRRLSVAMSGGHLVTPNKAYENSYRTEPVRQKLAFAFVVLFAIVVVVVVLTLQVSY